MNLKEKILISATTLVCPPVGLIMWFKLHKAAEQHANNLSDLMIKGFGEIVETLESEDLKEEK